jgi:predicted ATPase
MQILRGSLQVAAEAAIARLIEAAPSLVQLIPELASQAIPIVARRAADPGAALQFELFDAIAAFFRTVAAQQPLILIVDDAHLADATSCQLLRFLTHTAANSRLLLVATMCEGPEPAGASLAALAELRRECHVCALAGFSEGEVSRFIAATYGVDSPPALVATLQQATHGNPFFVAEITRSLAQRHCLDTPFTTTELLPYIPSHIYDAVRRHLRPLSQRAPEVLAAAAILGREFDAETLRRVIEREHGGPAESGTRETLLAWLAEMVALGVLIADVHSLGRYRFAHALIREVLYLDTPSVERAGLHCAAGATLEEALLVEPAEIAPVAHHFYHALPIADRAKVIDYQCRAAEWAQQHHAYEQAILHYRRALALTEEQQPAGLGRRCEVLTALGNACMRHGDRAGAQRAFERAATLARQSERMDLFPRAVLGLSESRSWVPMAGADRQLEPLIEEALAVADAGDASVRARLLGRAAFTQLANRSRGRRARCPGAGPSTPRPGNPGPRLV